MSFYTSVNTYVCPGHIRHPNPQTRGCSRNWSRRIEYLKFGVLVDILGSLAVQDELRLIGHSHNVVLHGVTQESSTERRKGQGRQCEVFTPWCRFTGMWKTKILCENIALLFILLSLLIKNIRFKNQRKKLHHSEQQQRILQFQHQDVTIIIIINLYKIYSLY